MLNVSIFLHLFIQKINTIKQLTTEFLGNMLYMIKNGY